MVFRDLLKPVQFPYVYLSGMEDGIFPSYMTITSDDPSAIEEERRLAYVGITRAKEELTLTCARQRMASACQPQKACSASPSSG